VVENVEVAASLSLELIVLSSLLDDVESLDSMRSHGNVAPYGLALVEEATVADEVRRLLKAGLIEPLVLDALGAAHKVIDSEEASSGDLTRYWFRPTYRGWQRLWDHYDAVRDYWDSEVR
jgi:hypothetical protein